MNEDNNFRCYQCGCLFATNGSIQREDSSAAVDDLRGRRQGSLRKP